MGAKKRKCGYWYPTFDAPPEMDSIYGSVVYGCKKGDRVRIEGQMFDEDWLVGPYPTRTEAEEELKGNLEELRYDNPKAWRRFLRRTSPWE